MLPAQQREAVGRFEILLFWLQEHTKKYNQMIISSINEVKNISFTDLLHKIDKNSSEYNLRLCLRLLHFSSSQKNGVRKMPLTLAAKMFCIHTGRTCARCLRCKKVAANIFSRVLMNQGGNC